MRGILSLSVYFKCSIAGKKPISIINYGERKIHINGIDILFVLYFRSNK